MVFVCSTNKGRNSHWRRKLGKVVVEPQRPTRPSHLQDKLRTSICYKNNILVRPVVFLHAMKNRVVF